MLKELRQLMGLMGQMPNLGKLKEEMERFQQQLSQISAEGDAGAGMVKVRVNGKMEVLSCSLSDEALRLNDREMLEDLIRGAMNQALQRIHVKVAEETNKMAGELGLPLGALGGFPGMGGS